MEKQTADATKLKKKRGIYRGYGVLVACFFIMTLVSGAQASFGIFFKPMLNEFGWTRASTSLPFSLNLVLCGLFGILAGRFSDRVGPKSVVAIGGVILGAGYILMSRITNLWGLYLSYGILVALGSSAFYVPLVSTITKWFPKKRGMMVGIGVSGIGFGIAVVPTVASHLMVDYDWQLSLFIVGVTCLVLIAILAQFLKTEPANLPADKAPEKKPKETVSVMGLTFNEAIKTRQFWMIFVAWLLYGFFFQVGAVHTVPYATDLGITALAAATLLSIIGIIGIIGRSGLGWVGDKFNNKATLALSFFLISVVFFIITISATAQALYIYAVVYGLFSGVGVLLASINAEHFGMQSLGAITGAIVFGNSIGGAIGPSLAGYIFDATDSYRLAFILCGFSAIASGAIVWLLKPSTKSISGNQ